MNLSGWEIRLAWSIASSFWSSNHFCLNQPAGNELSSTLHADGADAFKLLLLFSLFHTNSGSFTNPLQPLLSNQISLSTVFQRDSITQKLKPSLGVSTGWYHIRGFKEPFESLNNANSDNLVHSLSKAWNETACIDQCGSCDLTNLSLSLF